MRIGLGFLLDYVLNFAKCLLAFGSLDSFHLILFHFLSFHFISFHLGDEMDQYLNVDQWQKKPETEPKKEESKKEEEPNEESKSMSG